MFYSVPRQHTHDFLNHFFTYINKKNIFSNEIALRITVGHFSVFRVVKNDRVIFLLCSFSILIPNLCKILLSVTCLNNYYLYRTLGQ